MYHLSSLRVSVIRNMELPSDDSSNCVNINRTILSVYILKVTELFKLDQAMLLWGKAGNHKPLSVPVPRIEPGLLWDTF